MKQISIKARLIGALIIFLAAFLCFGLVTVMKVRELERVTNNIYDDPLKVSAAAIEARVDIIKIQREIRDVMLLMSGEERDSKEREMAVMEKRIISNLDIIKGHAINADSLEIEEDIRDTFIRWRKNHQQMLDYVDAGNQDSALKISQDINTAMVQSMEKSLIKIDKNALTTADNLVRRAGRIQQDLEMLLLYINIGLAAFFIVIFTLVIRGIMSSISKLEHSMNESAITGELKEAVLEWEDEIAGIARYYNALIQKLKHQFWLKDGQNMLNQELSLAADFSEMNKRALNFIVNAVKAGKGALYVYNDTMKLLEMQASYALTEKEQKDAVYSLGEGLVGQAALQQKPIYLENIKNDEQYIITGIRLMAPINIYTFPLVHDGKIQGVIQLASYEEFDDLKCEFLNEASQIVGAGIYSEIQNQKVKRLLEISEKTQMEARYNASQLLRTNQKLEEQQTRLQQQSEELRQTNAELEEQQQLLQQQSEELQQTNIQLEEQQLMLEEQTKLLNLKNQQLETSRLELLKHSQELETGTKYKSQFLANMSHELRTPLNSIILLSRLLMKNDYKELKGEHLEKLDVIYRSGQELLRLINEILDLSKIEAGKMNVDFEPFHSKELLTELMKLFEGEAREKDIELVCKDQYDSKIYGDYNKIAQIMRNLISNAIKFTSQGTVSIKIETVGITDVRLSVADTGIGISPDNIDRVFEEFHQGDGSISRKYGGTGLGLSISKKLADVMNGEITVESEEGKGSVFTLCLKNASFEANNPSKAQSKLDHVSLTQKEAAAAGGSNGTVLIIEDDKAFAEYLKEISEKAGYQNIIAYTGTEGLRAVRKTPVDAVLLDLTLPDISGIDVLHILKSTQELRGIPVCIISAKEKDNEPQRMGAVGYFQKPVAAEKIVEIIREMVSFKERGQKNLLIVESDEAQRKSLRELLRDRQVAIDAIASEEDAINKLKTNQYDAIVLGWLPESGYGVSVCEYMNSKGLETPIVIYKESSLIEEQEQNIRKLTENLVCRIANTEDELVNDAALFLHRVRKNSAKPIYMISRTNKKHALTLENKTILIVDDDPRNVFVLASALEDFGADIIEASNGSDALEVLEQQPIDLVLLDIMMPVMDGYEVIKKIRNSTKYSLVPVIAVTAKSLEGDKSKCIEAGANDYISKPVDYDNLVRLVKAWIDK